MNLIPTYEVRKRLGGWSVTRLDQTAHVGLVRTRKEAVNIAKMLAGWRGQVLVVTSRKGA